MNIGTADKKKNYQNWQTAVVNEPLRDLGIPMMMNGG
jgi:hypothetical protein